MVFISRHCLNYNIFKVRKLLGFLYFVIMKLGTFVSIVLCSFSLFSQEYLPKSSGEIVKHKYYTLSYNEVHEQADWVHYKLHLLKRSTKTSLHLSRIL